MKYKISHVTTYEYTDVVPVCQNVAHLTPRTTPGQKCLYHRLNVRPLPGEISRRTDFFGNLVQDFSIHQSHRALRVTAISKVQVTPVERPAAAKSPAWEAVRERVRIARTAAELQAYQFCFGSPHVSPNGNWPTTPQRLFRPVGPCWRRHGAESSHSRRLHL